MHLNCVGVGVGPANLSLASLLYRTQVSNLFVEKGSEFGWHEGQLIPGASLQVSILKDLVSLADPTNPFSFLSYLHSQGKIYHFLNAQFDAVPRQEFRNYMKWASHGNENVAFDEEVLSVDFAGTFAVETSRRTVTADNIVVGVGSYPWVPPQGQLSGVTGQFHVSDFMNRAQRLGGKRVCVVGGGQSGAEAFLDLVRRTGAELPRRVSWVSRRSNFLPMDDSPFTNDFYMPCHSDYFFDLDREVRERFNTRQVLSSDGISESTLRAVYQQIYTHRFVNGAEDLVTLHPNRAVHRVSGDDAHGWDIALSHNDQPTLRDHVEADVIIWATGFRPAPMGFLDPIAGRLEREADEYRIDSHFAVSWDGPSDRNVFVQNAARRQRGHADANLSLNAWRSRRIADRLQGVRSDEQLPSFIEWSAKFPGGRGGQ